uniref:Putative lysozyme-like protein n=1 Tax=Anopheles darlingi TaxID=43151 RepID=A0A2M4CQQ3_ANODA
MSKTIETHLQSNEVRIPKKTTEFDMTGAGGGGPAVQYFKSSFARSLSFSQGPGGGGGPYGAADQHFTRSLDFDVNYDPGMLLGSGNGGGTVSRQMTPASASPVFEEDLGQPDGQDELPLGGGIAHSNGGIVKTLWSYAKGQDIKSANNSPIKHGIGLKSNGSPGPRKSIEANEIEVLRLRKECQNLIEENRRLMNLAASTSAGGSGGGAMYAISSGMLLHSGSGSGSLSTLGMGIPNGAGGGGSGGNGSYTNVESVILQTQVETLQWQLKQVDSSRHMYRAVMEEVVRFLDRCYRSLDALQAAGQIGRSKSVLQVSGATGVATANGGSKLAGQQPHHGTTINHHQHQHHHHDSDSSSASSPRARSSTNLIEGPKAYTKASLPGGNGRLEQQQQHQQHQQSMSLINTSGVAPTTLHEDDCNVPPSPASSYSTFRDFTWRRSPKRTQTLPISSNEVDPEKLAQEAFRLLRTVQNLLNTQEPTLAQSTNALDSLISSTAASSCGSSTTLTGVGLSASGNGINGGGSGSVLGSSMPTLTGINGGGGGGAGAGAGATAGAGTGAAHMTNGGGIAGGTAGSGLAASGLVNTRSTVGFSRKLNMRGSRLSVRSSTADSVHSTSSSTKTETDEDSTDRPSPPLILPHPHHHHHHHHLLMQHHQTANGGHGGMANGGAAGAGGGPGLVGGSSSSTSSTSSNSSSCSSSTTSGNGHHHHHNHHTNRYSANIERIKEMMISSSAEDESGFSSMNSFQEIGLPLINSTMLSSIGSVDSSSHHGGVSSSASSADAGSNNGSGGSGGEGGTGSTGADATSGTGGTGTGGNSGPFGLSDDSSVLRENTVIPTNAGSTMISSNSANRLGIPSSPARTTVSTTASTSSTTSPATTISSTTNGTANGPVVNGSPLRVTQNSSYEHHTHFVNHRRWDSAPVVPPKLKIHTGETDTVSRVLWV